MCSLFRQRSKCACQGQILKRRELLVSGATQVQHGRSFGRHTFHIGCAVTCVTISATGGMAEELQVGAGAPEEASWAYKMSVLAALQEAGTMRPKRPHAEHDADDPMLCMNVGDDAENPLLSTGTDPCAACRRCIRRRSMGVQDVRAGCAARGRAHASEAAPCRARRR